MAETGQDTGFDMQSNAAAPVSSEAAATMVKEVAHGTDDGGQARSNAKQVDDKAFKEEFEIGHEEAGEEDGVPEKETEVETEHEDLEDKGEEDEGTEDPDADADKTPTGKKDEKGEEGGEEVEPIGDWLKDVDGDTRQEILDEFIESNADLVVTVAQNGQEVEMTIADAIQQAGRYGGEEAVEQKIADARAEIARQQENLKTREEFLGKQLSKPTDLLEFLDANVEDPVKYYTAVRDHAESVLRSAEEDPAGFRRDTAIRRDNSQLRSELSEIKDLLKDLKPGTGTPDAGDEKAQKKAQEEAMKKEGAARRKFVTDAGFKVSDVQTAWHNDDEPSDFYRWFAQWIKSTAKDTSTRAKKSTNKNRRRGGKTLRRRAGSKPVGTKEEKITGTPNAKEMAEFLVNHPTNKGRLT
jgi:hypothetical protein